MQKTHTSVCVVFCGVLGASVGLSWLRVLVVLFAAALVFGFFLGFLFLRNNHKRVLGVGFWSAAWEELRTFDFTVDHFKLGNSLLNSELGFSWRLRTVEIE